MSRNEAIEFYWTSVKARAALKRLEARCASDSELNALWAEAGGGSTDADCDVAFARMEMVK